MRITIVSFFFLLLFGVAFSGKAQDNIILEPTLPIDPLLYGYNVYSGVSKTVVGPVRFLSSSPARMTSLAESDVFVTAGEYAEGTWYVIVQMGVGVQYLATIDLVTGERQLIAPVNYTLLDMAYNYRTKQMYGLSSDGRSLLQIDLKTGYALYLGSFHASTYHCITLACTKEGSLYALGNQGSSLHKIDANTGEGRLIGYTGIKDTSQYKQSMAFNRYTNTLYWASADQGNGCKLYTVDSVTAKLEFMGYLGNTIAAQSSQIVSLFIPYDPAVSASAPRHLIDLKATPFSGKADSLLLTWSNPSRNADGSFSFNRYSRLPSKIYIYRDTLRVPIDSILASTDLFGQTLSSEKVLYKLPPGKHTFKLVPVNSSGRGIAMEVKAFLGEDVPDMVGSLLVTKQSATKGLLSWTHPRKGTNGGWVDTAALQYSIVRQPGNVTLTKTHKGTSFTDSVSQLGVYSYLVTPLSAKGTGVSRSSSQVVLGNALKTPWMESFDQGSSSFLLWKVSDANADSATWSYESVGGSGNSALVRVSSHSKNQSNDWLFTPPISLIAGKEYRLTWHLQHSPMYEEEYVVRMGNKDTLSGQTLLLWNEKTTANLSSEREVVFTASSSGTYYFSWQYKSVGGRYGIGIDQVSLEELFDYDIQACSLVAPEVVMLSKSFNYTVKLKNKGKNAASSVTVKVMDANRNILGSKVYTGTLKRDSVLEIAVPCVALTVGNYPVRAIVSHSSDLNKANDTSLTTELTVLPYLIDIYRASQLDSLRFLCGEAGLGMDFYLNADIDLSAYTASTYGSKGWKPIGDSERPFLGRLHGGGKRIKGLRFVRPDENYVGLFGCIGEKALVEQVGIEVLGSDTVYGNDYTGLLVGRSKGEILNCYVRGSLVGKGDYVGGLTGMNEGKVMNSYSEGWVKGYEGYVGGIAGVNQGSIQYCYAYVGVIGMGTYKGAFVGWQGGEGSIQNCFYETSRTNLPGVGQDGNTKNTSLVGKSASDMRKKATFTGWNLTSTWSVAEALTFPYLAWEIRVIQGNGSSTSPFLITNVWQLDQLRYMLGPNSMGVYFRIMNDLDFAEFLAEESPIKGWEPIGQYNGNSEGPTVFLGIIQGNQKRLKRFWIKRPTESIVGLFACLGKGALVENLELNIGADSIVGSSSVGGIAGLNYGTIRGCCVIGNLSGKSNLGSIAGENMVKIVSCYAQTTLVGNNTVGGITGFNFAGTIDTCMSYSRVIGGQSLGPICASAFGGKITNSYYDKDICPISNGYGTGRTTAQLKQKSNFIGWDFIKTWALFENVTLPKFRWQVCTPSTPISSSSGDLNRADTGEPKAYSTPNQHLQYLWEVKGGTILSGKGTNAITVKWEVIGDQEISLSVLGNNGCFSLTPVVILVSVTEGFAGGIGTYENPYRIETPAQLDKMHEFEGSLGTGKYFRLSNDIDLKEYLSEKYPVEGWKPIRDFQGRLDGNGYCISHLYINRPQEDYVGLFGSTKGAEIACLRIQNDKIVGGSWVGSLVGEGEGGFIISCFSEGTASLGLGGYGSIQGNDYVGGLIGHSISGEVLYSYSKNFIKGNIDVGGLIGLAEGDALNDDQLKSFYQEGNALFSCYSQCVISGGYLVGGLVGRVIGASVSNCYVIGKVEGENYVGGLVGLSREANFFACYSASTISGRGYALGGIAGLIEGYITMQLGKFENCFYDVQVQAKSSIGLIPPVGDRFNYLYNMGVYSRELWLWFIGYYRGVIWPQSMFTHNMPNFQKDVTVCEKAIWAPPIWVIDPSAYVYPYLFWQSSFIPIIEPYYSPKAEELDKEKQLLIQAETISLSPNPTTDKLLVKGTLSDTPIVEVYSIQGKLLFTCGNLVDLSAYPAGIYLIKVEGKMLKALKQ